MLHHAQGALLLRATKHRVSPASCCLCYAQVKSVYMSTMPEKAFSTPDSAQDSKTAAFVVSGGAAHLGADFSLSVC